MEKIGAGRSIRHYALNGKPFDGWSIQVFEDGNERSRYTKFEQGLAVWQIGYAHNGRLGHDFHLKDGVNCGSQRMWHMDGQPYINTYCEVGDVPHGVQRRWHPNGALAREAEYSHGDLLYEVLLDASGTITSKEGPVPIRYK